MRRLLQEAFLSESGKVAISVYQSLNFLFFLGMQIHALQAYSEVFLSVHKNEIISAFHNILMDKFFTKQFTNGIEEPATDKLTEHSPDHPGWFSCETGHVILHIYYMIM